MKIKTEPFLQIDGLVSENKNIELLADSNIEKAAILYCNNCAYICKNKDVEVTLKFDAEIVDLKVSRHNGRSYLIAATVAGCVYRVPCSDVFSTVHNDSGNGDTPMSDSEDIFSELLADQAPNTSAPVGQPVFVVTDSFLLLKAPQVTTLLPIPGGSVAVVSKSDIGWALSVHEISTNDDKRDISSRSVYSTFIRQKHQTVCSSVLQRCKCEDSTPRLTCIIPESFNTENRDFDTDASEHWVRVTSKLYTSLFGEECSILNSLVLLVSLPGGLCHAVSLKKLSRTLSSTIVCHLEQKPIGIFGLTSEVGAKSRPTGSSGPSDTLLFIGHEGRMVFVSNGNQGKLSYHEHIVTGPVCCCSYHDNHLLYSTGVGLKLVNIEEWESKTKSILQKDVHNLTLYRVKGLAVYQGSLKEAASSKDENAPCKFVTLSSTGAATDVELLSANPADDSSPEASNTPQSSVHRIQDLLLSINDLAEKLTSSRRSMVEMNGVVSQLVITGNLACAAVRSEVQSPLGVTVITVVTDMGNVENYSLQLCVVNNTKVDLLEGWSVTMSVKSQTLRSPTRSKCEGDVENLDCDKNLENYETSVSASLPGLSPGMFRKVHKELPRNLIGYFPLKVKVVLHFNPFLLHRSSELKMVGVSVAVLSQTMDVINTLQPEHNSSESRFSFEVDHHPKLQSLEATIDELAKRRPFSNQSLKENSTRSTAGSKLNTCQLALTHAQRMWLNKAASLSASTASPESWLLRMLVEGSHVKTDTLSPDQTSIKARVESEQVSLSVRNSQGADGSSPETNVHIQATCPKLLYQILVAVQTRLKKFQSSMESDEINVEIPEKELRKKLKVLQGIKKQLVEVMDKSTKDVSGFSDEVIPGVKHELLTCHSHLRKLSLPF